MIIGTAGHIDHGKTALVRALTGIDTDRLKEEKARGITIELGYAYEPVDASVPTGPRIGFVDMPGHERFIPTMLCGATGIGFALLVIAADDGVMPQTREHLQILQLLGMQQGIVALTKCDLVEPARLDQVRHEITTLLGTTFLASAPVMAVSTVTGYGIDALKACLIAAATAWHAARATPTGTDHRNGTLFRLAVDRAFSLEGRGTIVTGTVHAGALQVGDVMRILPSGAGAHTTTARVRSLHALDCPVERCEAGQRVSLNLVGIERTTVHRGDWIVADTLTHLNTRVAISLSLLPEARTLQHWTPVHVHVGALHVTAHVALLEGERLVPGATMLAELVLATPLHLCHGDRIVVRDASAQLTIAGGTVLDVFPPARNKRSAHRLALLNAQRDTTACDALQATIALEIHGVDLTQFAANRTLPLATIELLLAQLSAISVRSSAAVFACSAPHWQQMQQHILEALSRFHLQEPDTAGVERDRLRRVCLPTVAAPLFAELLLHMMADQQIVSTCNGFIALPQYQVVFSATEAQLWIHATALLALTPFQPPRVRPMALEMQLDEDAMRRLLGKSARIGHTMMVAHDHYFLDSAVLAMAEQVRLLCVTSQETSVAPFRDRIGTGRKLAVQILEFFNRIGYTRRIQDRHLIRQADMWCH